MKKEDEGGKVSCLRELYDFKDTLSFLYLKYFHNHFY